VFATRRQEEWGALLDQNDVPFAPVLNIEEVMSDPQIQELGTFYQVNHPTEGEVWGIHPPLLFDGERLGRVSAPPTLGEHTKEVIDELKREDDAARDPKSAV
jgi:crotonobetainyl-CoA:carnitine CoA-transferase CaiB-like acyl-CoA transferase